MKFISVEVVKDDHEQDIKVGSLVKDDYVCGHSAKVISLHKEVDEPNYKAIIADIGGNLLTCYKVGDRNWYPKLEVLS